jgi:hypothetical protein
MSNVLKFKETSAERCLRRAAEEGLEEMVLFGFKGNDYWVFSTELISRTQMIGGLEIIKHDILEE